jgi:asparagine synthase (glutamine-hydrolysing)
MDKLTELLRLSDPGALYRSLASVWPDPTPLVANGVRPIIPGTTPFGIWPEDQYTHALMYLDTVSYLPDDILTKVDRASMAVSLEARVPLLDHRVVEFAWRLPLGMKIRTPRTVRPRAGTGKWLLRQVLYRYVPPALVDRPKTGFSIPIGMWLRGPLREWAEGLLAASRIRAEGFFEPAPVRRAWAAHLGGSEQWEQRLWAVLMFQAWSDQESQRRNPIATTSQRPPAVTDAQGRGHG